MIVHEVRVHPSAARLPREAQLTWKIAELAAAAPPPEADVAHMVACRVVDNAVSSNARGRKSVDALRTAGGHQGAGRVGVLGQCHGRARAGLP